MSPTPSRPAGLDGAGARLQPDTDVEGADVLGDHPDGQLKAWLADPVFNEEAKHLDRLLGDADLLLKLQLSGYAPKGSPRRADERGCAELLESAQYSHPVA